MNRIELNLRIVGLYLTIILATIVEAFALALLAAWQKVFGESD